MYGLYSIFESINIGSMLVKRDTTATFTLFINEVHEAWHSVVI